MNAPSEAGDTQSQPVLEELDRAECLKLIAGSGIGRVAFDDGEGPTIIPVNYTLDGESVIFRTTPAGRLHRNVSSVISGADVRIAFEVDHMDAASHEGWSVLLRGGGHQLDGTEGAEIASVMAKVKPWAGGDRTKCFRLVPSVISGRRLRQA